MLNTPLARLGHWFESKILRFDYYELRGSEVFSVRAFAKPKFQFKLDDVRRWQQIILCFGVAVIEIESLDGRKLRFTDKYGCLLRILQRAVPEKELPWRAES